MRRPAGSAARRAHPSTVLRETPIDVAHAPRALHPSARGRLTPRNRLLARRGFTAGLACTLVLIAGCKPATESVQWGYRGNSMIQVYNPNNVKALAGINAIPTPEPSDPYDPSFPMATEIHQNVQVLTDLNALEFARLMNAMTTWIAPEEGCAYCHNTENLADDSKYTKVVSRQMLNLTRDINANWTNHVAATGVTCWTCHRGQPVPSDIWFTTPPPKTPSSGWTGWKGGQNVGGVAINGNSSLPYDPLTPFLLEDYDIRIQGTQALPYGNRQSIKQGEWTYSLMMYMSKSLGVNCTYCHQTRAMGLWEESTPQRVTAWHGIRMVRGLNNDHLVPLKPFYPEDRLGPTGDAPKAACATCHKGTYKPLYGETMLEDYPSLRGVLPGRLSPDPTQGGVIPISVAPEGAVVATMEERTRMAEAMLAAAEGAAEDAAATGDESEPASEPDPEVAAAEPDVAEEAVEVETETLAPTEAEGEAAAEAAVAAADSVEASADSESAIVSSPESEPQAAAALPADGEMVEPVSGETAESVADNAAVAEQNAEALAAEVQRLRNELEARSAEPGDRDSLDAAEARIAAMRARLEQQTEALEQQLDVVRRQRDRVGESVAAELRDAHDEALDSAERSLRAVQARLDQQRTALEQQLGVVRSQRDEALAQARSRIAEREHAIALAAAARQISAIEARLDQQTQALGQQLAVVREQRNQASEEVAARIPADEHADTVRKLERRIRAIQARLDQNTHALRQQLQVVRAQRNDSSSLGAERVALLEQEHAEALEVAEADIAAREVRLAQEREALRQQLAVVREQRDVFEAELSQLRDSMQASEAARAEALARAQAQTEAAEAAAAEAMRGRALASAAAAIGGEITDDGIVVNLGGDRLRFASGSATLPNTGLPDLDRVAELLAERPELAARIEGHTDSVGSPELNQSLSQQRAESVLAALVERGVDPARLSAVGIGPDRPIADNGTAAGRSQNRRVELYVTSREQVASGSAGAD